MSLVKSLSVGDGDMFYINHNTDNFSIIDCCLPVDRGADILDEIASAEAKKGITRFISTHPDQDHIEGLGELDDRIDILNFYVVKNSATKTSETSDFKRYKELRDHERKAFYIERGSKRRWMNQSNEVRCGAGIHVLWPIVSDEEFQKALDEAEDGGSPNNISAVVTYSLEDGVRVLWMGDLETPFMESISDVFTPDPAQVLFAPHHGRKSGHVPSGWMEAINPTIVVVGEAPSSDLDYYTGYNTITQNTSGDIAFECLEGKTHVFVGNVDYSVDFLDHEDVEDRHGHYIGTFHV